MEDFYEDCDSLNLDQSLYFMIRGDTWTAFVM